MGTGYILTKGKKSKHTYSNNLKEKLEKEGWKAIYRLDGWNLSFTNLTEVNKNGNI